MRSPRTPVSHSFRSRLLCAALVVVYAGTLGLPYVALADGRRGTGTRDIVTAPSSSGTSGAASSGDTANAGGASPAPATGALLPSGSPSAGSGVSPQAIRLPSAEGTVQGMGESFSPVLSAGVATFSVPIAVAPGRNGVQPSFNLSYSSSGGNGVVGIGWSIGAPMISRQTDRGLPQYIDRSAWHAQEDRFIDGAGNELVPVDSSQMAAVDASGLGYATGRRPSDVGSGWQEYRARVEGGFNRIFRAPDYSRWVVLTKDGSRMDFGKLPQGTFASDLDSDPSLVRDPQNAVRIFGWYLTRFSDSHGSTIYYTYVRDRGQVYLSDVHYVSPASCAPSGASIGDFACHEELANYGARIHFDYDCPGTTDPASCRPDRFVSYSAGFRVETAWRLSRITVTAYEDSIGARALVRRYHLTYIPGSFHSQLSSIQIEGRSETPDLDVGVSVFAQVPETSLTGAIVGATLPPMQFGYSTQPSSGAQAIGFGGLSSTVRTVQNSPPVSLGTSRTDLFDVNGDGLPDVLVTDPARYRTRDGQPAAGVFFNGFSGATASPSGRAAAFSAPIAVPMDASLSGVFDVDNVNIIPMDADGDGRGDFMHLPRLREYGWFTPARTNVAATASVGNQGWRFAYAKVQLPSGDADPRIDLLNDSTHFRAFDVNNDHLVDIVRTTGTEMQTWLNLGWLPGGEGRFGQASRVSDGWSFSTEPIRTCLLNDGLPLDFADPTIRIGELNGDGVPDIVRIQRGRISYWPGRGGAAWGDGPIACSVGQGAGRHTTVMSPPAELGFELTGVELVDVDHDGLDDVLQVRTSQVDVWFNRAGASFTERITIGTPFAPDFTSRYRLADIDGSGTMDVVYGVANDWRFVDLLGGVRPRLLTTIDNDLGATTTLRYGNSTEDYLADLFSAASSNASCSSDNCDVFLWDQLEEAQCDTVFQRHGDTSACYRRSGHSPVVSSVVRSVETHDHFDRLGREANVLRTEYAYHDGYYDGLEQEFRGFRVSDARQFGDATAPTARSRTWFLQGRRPTQLLGDRSADNPNEALKGRASMAETFDEGGRYLGTTHATFVVRKLATGLDGRAVSYAFVNQSDQIIYDTSASVGPGPILSLPAAVTESVGSSGDVPSGGPASESHDLQVRSADFAWIRSTIDRVDNVGNVLESTSFGRIHDEDEVWSGTPNVRYDEIVRSFATPTLLAGACGNGAAWTWRTASSFMTGNDQTRLHEYASSFSCSGDPHTSRAYARNDSADLDFGTLGAPPTDEVLISGGLFDAWGHSLAVCAGADLQGGASASACLGYGEVQYDATFAQVATRSSVAVDASSGSHCSRSSPLCMLDATGTFDRGLGVALSATDPNGVVSSARYDGLGRLVYALPPNTSGCSTGAPPTVIRYQVRPGGLPVSIVETTADARTADCQGANRTIGRTYVDGLGRVRASLSSGDTTGTWIRGDSHTLGAKGQASCGFTNSYVTASDPSPAQAVGLPSSPGVCGTRDAFGRMVQVVDYRDPSSPRAQVVHHALGYEVWDPLDLGLGLNGRNHLADTPTRVRVDGHGRPINEVVQLRSPGETAKQFIQTFTFYRADGVPTTIARAETTNDLNVESTSLVGQNVVFRGFSYDSLGRKTSTYDPDSDDLSPAADEARRHWRYRYNRVGNLAAVRDPRGCGQDFFYDRAGRLIGERYVGCSEAQPSGEGSSETVPAGSVGLDILSAAATVDARSYFDTLPPWSGSFANATTPQPASTYLRGRPSAASDRGRRSMVAYDARGLSVWTATQMAILPAEATNVPTIWMEGSPPFTSESITPVSRSYDTHHTYTTTSSYDHLGRPRSGTMPEDPDGVLYGGDTGAPSISARITYSTRGLPTSVTATVGAVDYPVLASAAYDVNGAPTAFTWGRAGRTVSEAFEYDARLRPSRHTVTLPTQTITNPLSVAPGVSRIVDDVYTWDVANNLVQVADNSGPSRRPAGYRQWRQTIQHDSLYRVANVDLEYRQNNTGSTTTWGPDDTVSNWRSERTRVTTAGGTHLSTDPMHREPAPMLPALPASRARNFTYDYDWLGNQTEWTDDASAFFERSLGNIQNGNTAAGGSPASDKRPSALYFATDLPESSAGTTDPAIQRGGYVSVTYGNSGNVVAMTAHGRCHDRVVDATTTLSCFIDPAVSGTPEERDDFAEQNCECDVEQHYEYRWDELNRLAETRRYDRAAANPNGRFSLKTRLRYRYDSTNGRTTKQVLDVYQADPNLRERIQLYVLPGKFERAGVRLDRSLARYLTDPNLGSETQYSVGGARFLFRVGSPPESGYDDDHRFTLAFGNLIRSTGAVVDLMSGDLLELATFLPNGQRETHRTSRTRPHAIEPDGFTGKEADEEVGLVYFGERYLIPQIGRWATPDPLAIHAAGGGEVLNSYHYVSGNLLQARDPVGLQESGPRSYWWHDLNQSGGNGGGSPGPASGNAGNAPPSGIDQGQSTPGSEAGSIPGGESGGMPRFDDGAFNKTIYELGLEADRQFGFTYDHTIAEVAADADRMYGQGDSSRSGGGTSLAELAPNTTAGGQGTLGWIDLDNQAQAGVIAIREASFAISAMFSPVLAAAMSVRTLSDPDASTLEKVGALAGLVAIAGTAYRSARAAAAARGALELGGFARGVSAAEIEAINRGFGGVAATTGHPSSALAAAANQSGFFNKSAAVIREIAGRHMFNDGNKRTASAVYDLLRQRNGISGGLTAVEAEGVIMQVARGDLRTIDEIAAALRGCR